MGSKPSSPSRSLGQSRLHPSMGLAWPPLVGAPSPPQGGVLAAEPAHNTPGADLSGHSHPQLPQTWPRPSWLHRGQLGGGVVSAL